MKTLFYTSVSFFLFAFAALAGDTKTDFSKVPGVVVDHSPASSKIYVGSPSICILPDGSYVASHDWFGKGPKKEMPPVFKSTDKGATWKKISNLPFGSATLFVHKGFLFAMNACSITLSEDGGLTWTFPPKTKRAASFLPRIKPSPITTPAPFLF